MKKRFLLLFVFLTTFFVYAQVPEKQLDELVKNTLKTFDVPGISVGIVKDGKIIYTKGFGVRSMKTNLPMDPNTLVGIASNSKGFTVTALAMLADEGKLNWTDPVSKFIPEFKMYDAYASQQVEIQDLITHRAGLGLGQGDLMFFPEGGTLSIEDIVHNVRDLKPHSSFRTKLDYNNVMFIIAGEVIRRITGLQWADFIQQRILTPVGMNSSYPSYQRAINIADKIDAHAPVDGKVEAVPHDWNETANAAGGIMSNIPDMLKWAQFLMNGFVTQDGKRLVSEKNAHILWSLHMPSPISVKNPYDSHFYGYGYGWFLSDVEGHFQVQHTGGLIGTVTQFTLIPDMKLGIVVLTNQQSGAAFNTITNTVKDSYLGIKNRNWLKTYSEGTDKAMARFAAQKKSVYDKVALAEQNPSAWPKPEQFVGTYHDNWFGDVVISQQGQKFYLKCLTSPRLTGEVLPYDHNTFVVKWDHREYDADAFLNFDYDENGIAQTLKIKPISDVTDFSFDFEDLHLKRVQ